jgi:hypothetical protein
MRTHRLLRRILTAAAVLLVMGTLPRAFAAVITLNVFPAAGYGLTQGAVCSTSSGFTCPADPAFALTASDPVSGSFTINTATDTASFNLTLSQSATFGAETLAAGSSFSGSGIDVTVSGTQASQTGAAVNGSAGVSFSGLTALASTPAISAFNCTLGSRFDVCGLSLGPSGTLLQDAASNQYDSFMTFNVETEAVPLPASLWSLLAGCACLLVLARSGCGAVLAARPA